MNETVKNYNHKSSESKWQKKWEESNCFKFDENSDKEKYYVLEMFPYPSGKIHMGHLRNYAIGDVVSRYKKMKGYNVLHPMGFDSFGLPAENAALEHQIHPREWTLKNIEVMKSELKSIGLSVDWSRELATCLPDYYKHEQKIFQDFVKNDLAYQKESFVNWDPVDQTVLANEQVIDGRGWRSGALVEKKKLKQWFLKVSEFSQDLLDELKNLKGWDERVLSMQEKWIGRSEGCSVKFTVENSDLGVDFSDIEVYTTRPETLFGASFIGIAANHPLALELAKKDEKAKKFIEKCNENSAKQADTDKQEKEGYDTGLKVTHPLDPELKLDVYIANFVLMDYGTGAIFACPAHDERDFDFAKKYDLPIKPVSVNLEEFLKSDEFIDCKNKEIQKITKEIDKDSENEIDFIKKAHEFVAKEISYPLDNENTKLQKPALIASEVLKNKTAFCFGRSTLFAAILRSKNIPCGFTDQLLALDEKNPKRKIIHNLNTVYLKNQSRWVRIDCRNHNKDIDNLESGNQSSFLTYEAENKFDEIDNLGIYHKIPSETSDLYKNSENNNQIIDNLFDKSSAHDVKSAFTGDGVMINSYFLDGLSVKDAKKLVIDKIEEGGFGKRQVNFKLRDWGVSRQRYWGCPIPMLYLEDGSVVPEEGENLPVELPDDVTFDGQGNPLAKHESWKNTTYRGQKAVREVDTFDTFFESSWYFLRFISPLKDKAFDKDSVNKFMPVDQYIGGVEHAVLHLLYARFFVKALKKCGYLDLDEPFKNLLTQGMVCHKTYKDEDGKWVIPSEVVKKDGELISSVSKKKVAEGRSEKMSKSKKNVVEPSLIVDAYGADTARLFMLSDSPVNRDLEWSDGGIDGCWKYVNRVWKLVAGVAESELFETNKTEITSTKLADFNENSKLTDAQKTLISLTHKTILEAGNEFEKMGFNVAIAKIREFSNILEKFKVTDVTDLKIKYIAVETLISLISPIMPHLSEECAAKLGFNGLICEKNFPEFNEKFTKETKVKIAVQVKSKMRSLIEVEKGASQDDVEKLAKSDENVAKFLDGATIKKVIFVKDRLLNFVI